jgi:hypothetical protein
MYTTHACGWVLVYVTTRDDDNRNAHAAVLQNCVSA